MKKSLGIYIHIPFCIKKCGYCDFCSYPGKDTEYMRAYTQELCKRIKQTEADGYTVDTVYFGGGTPSLLPLEQTENVLNAITSAFNVSPNAEITLECNPITAQLDYFRSIRNMGMNRLSIGLQSAHDSELKLLGRAHSCADFVHCYSDAQRAGFDNISADIMYGIPDQTLDSLADTLKFLCTLSPQHISAYGLTVEEGTDFHRHRNKLALADDDMQAQMYYLCSEKLEKCGYHKYEISNFSRTGFESKHNLRYWKGLEYIGFGVAAHSYFRNERFGNSRDINAFLEGKDITEERQALNDSDKKREYIMLRLRLAEGISAADYKNCFGKELWQDIPSLKAYIEQGFMMSNGEHISFTDKGFLVSNTILSDIIDFE